MPALVVSVIPGVRTDIRVELTSFGRHATVRIAEHDAVGHLAAKLLALTSVA